VSQQPLFKQTGGNHGVALFDSAQNIIDVREDIGRHNALDKVIGANASALLNQKNTNETKPIGLILSGRVGFEMIQKAALTNISFVLAFGATSSLAIQLAAECDIALVGFIKNRGFNVYCNEQLLGV
jgi:FdhD protein